MYVNTVVVEIATLKLAWKQGEWWENVNVQKRKNGLVNNGVEPTCGKLKPIKNPTPPVSLTKCLPLLSIQKALIHFLNIHKHYLMSSLPFNHGIEKWVQTSYQFLHLIMAEVWSSYELLVVLDAPENTKK